MPEFHETRRGAVFFDRDVPAIARTLGRIADALERLADARGELGPSPEQPAAHTTTTTAPAGDAEPRGADADEPRTED